MAKINPYKVTEFDGTYYQIEYFEFTPSMINKFCKMTEKSGGRNFFVDDFYVINKRSIGFKNKIPDYIDVDEVISGIEESNMPYAGEFLSQYTIGKDKIVRNDNRFSVNKINWWYFPVLVPFEKIDPNYEEYINPEEIIKMYGRAID